MAKGNYKVPTSLDRSMLDHEINLSSKSLSIRPTPLKQLIFIAGGFFAGIWLWRNTFIGSADGMLVFAFLLWFTLTTIYLGGLTKTKELRVESIPSLLEYLPRRSRRVLTRRNEDPSQFGSIVGIEDITEEGRIHFGDGSVGQAHLVVGSASYMLFDDDRIGILDRNDAFWRKIDDSCEWIQITTQEPQRIYHQVANLEQRNQDLLIRDPDLIELQNEQYDVLTEYVGGQFTSIHQYLIVKGSSIDSLERGLRVFRSEVAESSLMIKEATALDREETIAMLQVFYQGIHDDHPAT